MKFKTLLLLSGFLPLFALGQGNDFTLSVKIGNLGKPAKAYLDYVDNGVSHEDSTEVVDGAFQFTGPL